MEQFEQLLTCCVCLDRYRNPKLLPCQHSFCMEPCMDGLVDYVRRQVKCPECRAEHRIPYQGVQGFPTNVTLQRFLELHIEISGELPDPTANQIMERCNVCTEKAYCGLCGHCDKKVCSDCKSAHMDILRREIARINNQVRRGIHRLQDILSAVEKNTLSLQTNCSSVSEEVDEIHRRLGKALKDRTEYLRCEVDRYLGTELRNLSTLKDNLELEISNISSNCDLADKHMNEDVEWEDSELMDAKEIFLKTVEFIRNFDYEASDYGRRVRFVMAHDPNQLVLHVAGYGELNINTSNTGFTNSGSAVGGGTLQSQGSGPGLMRSKSDHRLATQFRKNEEARGYGEAADEPLLGGRKFGDRRPAPAADKYGDSSRYGRTTEDYGADEYGYDNESSRPRRFKSRFVRSQQQGDDSDNEQNSRNVKFNAESQKEKEKVFDTEDVARGPLSGIFRLTDSPRVMKRLQECESGKKKVKEVVPVPAPVVQPPKPQPKKPTPAPATRQLSEDDEIARIKRQNKGASSSAVETERPAAERVAALKQRTDEEERRRTPAATPAREALSDAESDESSGITRQQTPPRKPSVVAAPVSSAPARRESPPAAKKPATRSDSSESSASSEGTPAVVPPPKNTEAEKKEPARFQSRFLGGGNRPTSVPPPAAEAAPKPTEETDTSSEEETDSSEESEDDTTRRAETQAMAKSDIGPLLARSSNARETAQENKTGKDGSPSYNKPPYGKQEEPAASTRYRTRPAPAEEEPPSRYGTSGYQSRFLNKSKSSAAPAEEEDTSRYSSARAAQDDEESKYPTGRSRYLALKERRNRLARSRSSHTGFGGNDDDDLDEPVSPTTASPSAYLASRYGTASSGDLARSRSSHALAKSRETSPERPAPGAEKDGAAYSSWARYLKDKYGNRASKGERDAASGATGSAAGSSAASAAARRLSLGLPLRSAGELASSDDDQKNAPGSPVSPTAAATPVVAGFAAAGSSPRSQYLQKRRQLFKVGSRGSEAGSFTWPRGIAVGPDNSMVVADSSNHRVQVFDANGIFVKEFGAYGSGEGEFDCLAGVAVNRIGQYIIADRYNHRIQVLDPSGRFLRSFGSQGTGDGRFNYPWGITTDALGFIYVCDKENHRVQVFQSDGTFVGKFGSYGHKAGQLEHPHYIAVSSTNRVIVSDSNNHRVQIFDVNGRVLSSFGGEGSEEGQFKFPRGVAVDDQGYICVADSGNNRIQIFHPDGTFLRAFGSWGSGDAEFKGLEGIAVMSNGNIIVCDRENHRVQVF